MACDCIMHPIENYIDSSEYILIIKSVRIRDTFNYPYLKENRNVGFTTEASVVRVLKNANRIENGHINFDSDYSNCAMKFEVGKTYLIFAFRKNGRFYVYHCSYSDKYSRSRINIRKIIRYMNVHNYKSKNPPH